MGATPLFTTLSTIHGVHGFSHSTAFVIARNLALIFAIVFWLALAFWVHKDARRRFEDPILVLFAALLGLVPPYIGPIVYLLLRPSEILDDVRTRRVELSQADLDAALTAEAQRIAVVDNTIPLAPQPQPRVADA